jgi:hypothetical protein
MGDHPAACSTRPKSYVMVELRRGCSVTASEQVETNLLMESHHVG